MKMLIVGQLHMIHIKHPFQIFGNLFDNFFELINVELRHI